jgi:hypothetical protein
MVTPATSTAHEITTPVGPRVEVCEDVFAYIQQVGT